MRLSPKPPLVSSRHVIIRSGGPVWGGKHRTMRADAVPEPSDLACWRGDSRVPAVPRPRRPARFGAEFADRVARWVDLDLDLDRSAPRGGGRRPLSACGWEATWSRPIRPLDAGGPSRARCMHLHLRQRDRGTHTLSLSLPVSPSRFRSRGRESPRRCGQSPAPLGSVHASASRAMCRRHVTRVPTQRGSASAFLYLFPFLLRLPGTLLSTEDNVHQGQRRCWHVIFVWSRSRRTLQLRVCFTTKHWSRQVNPYYSTLTSTLASPCPPRPQHRQLLPSPAHISPCLRAPPAMSRPCPHAAALAPTSLSPPPHLQLSILVCGQGGSRGGGRNPSRNHRPFHPRRSLTILGIGTCSPGQVDPTGK
jgi:hypothetical protein